MKKTMLALATLVSAAAFAAPVAPTFTTFGNLAGATWGGSGIPTDPAAITTGTVGGAAVTLGLIAHQRFSNPVLGNDGNGTYTAQAGLNNGLAGGSTLGATWNFGFYVRIAPESGLNITNFNARLLYDLDAGVDTDESALGVIDLDAAVLAGGGIPGAVTEGSENLYFAYLASDIPGLVTAPGGSFNPFAAGEYSFVLELNTVGSTAPALRSAINVNVEAPTAVPEPGSLALVGGALLSLAALRRRRA